MNIKVKVLLVLGTLIFNLYCVSKTADLIFGSETEEETIQETENVIDTILPTVNITSPINNSIVSDTVTISVDVSDNKGIHDVDFYIDNKFRYSDTTAPYTYNWNTINYYTGNHSLMARAYDTSNNVGSSTEIYVIVKNCYPSTECCNISNCCINENGLCWQTNSSAYSSSLIWNDFKTYCEIYLLGRMPSKDELKTGYNLGSWNQSIFGSAASTFWSGTEVPGNETSHAYSYIFFGGAENNGTATIKETKVKVRCVK